MGEVRPHLVRKKEARVIIIGVERSCQNTVTVCLVCRIEMVYGVFVAVKIRQIYVVLRMVVF